MNLTQPHHPMQTLTSESVVLLSVLSVASLLPHWVELPVLFDVLFVSLLQSSHSGERQTHVSRSVTPTHVPQIRTIGPAELNVDWNRKLTRVLSVSNAAREPLPSRSSASSFSSSSSSSSSFYGEKKSYSEIPVLIFLANKIFAFSQYQTSCTTPLPSSYL